MHIEQALPPSHPALLRGVADATQGVGQAGHAGKPGDDVGQQGRLVVAALKQAPRMQRHRHDQFGIDQQFGTGPRHPPTERGSGGDAIGMLEAHHHAFGGIVIAKHRPRPPERRRSPEAGTAQKGGAGIEVEGLAAARTGRRTEKAHPFPARRAQGARRFDHGSARQAAGRDQDIEQQAKHPPESPEQRPHQVDRRVHGREPKMHRQRMQPRRGGCFRNANPLVQSDGFVRTWHTIRNATARHLDALLATVDQKVLSYAKAGHVKVRDAGT